jgi:ribosomal-protein-alanine N-acetyltransferase
MADIVIRPMSEEDIPQIMEIERSSFSTPWSEISFLGEIYKKNAFSNVTLFEGNIIGYICVNYLLHESHILNLAVHELFRRRGVATILMNDTLNELKKKGCVFIYLEVRASNAGAKKFYELFGFTVESIRKKYYANPDEDALLMMGRI